MFRHCFSGQGLWPHIATSALLLEPLCFPPPTLPQPGLPYRAMMHPLLFPCTTSFRRSRFLSLEWTSISDRTTSRYESANTRCWKGASSQTTGRNFSTENSPHFLLAKENPCNVGGSKCAFVAAFQSGSSPRLIISASFVFTSSLRLNGISGEVLELTVVGSFAHSQTSSTGTERLNCLTSIITRPSPLIRVLMQSR